jgi:hypothetical protein
LNHRRLNRHVLLGLAGISAACAAPVPITGAGSYSQDFDTLPSTGTANAWADDTTIAGWYAQRAGTGTVVVIASNGTNSGGIHSFGTTEATERALGSVGSNTTGHQAYGVVFQNTSGSAITINAINYTGEQWRNGGNATAHKLTLSYLRSATPITALSPPDALPAGWIAVAGGDFTGPVATATGAALDGNLAANQATVAMAPSISIADGEYICLRWHDPNDAVNDHGLGIDNLAVSWITNATPAITLTADPTTFAENAGATASTGTVAIPAALATELVVNLTSSDVTEATVPATVTIPASETKVTFPIAAVNDLLADGTQGVTLTAKAEGFLDGTVGLTVDNDTDFPITVTVTPPTFSEGAAPGTVTGTVALAEVTPVDVLVTLTSDDTTEATASASVTIPANESSVSFEVNAVPDTEVDGSKSVRIDATASGYTPGFTRITVTDDDLPPTPTLTAGAIAFTGFNADGGDDLAFVALAPIPAGEIIFFTDNEWNGDVIGVDGAFNTGEGFLTWTAPAEGVAAGTVVTLNSLSLGTRSASVGSLTTAGSFNMGGSSETVYAYQGTSATAATGFLAVVANSAGDSTANTGLGANHIILLTIDVDIAAYTGSRSNKTTFAGYLDSLAAPANWITEDGSNDQSIGGNPPDVPFATTAFTLAPPSAYGTWAGLHAGGGAPNEDFDNDGVRNGVEYFMDSPDGFTANPVPVGGKITWPHSAAATGATYKVFTSENLSTWTDVTAATTDLDGKVEYIVPTTTPSLFVRLEVTVTP